MVIKISKKSSQILFDTCHCHVAWPGSDQRRLRPESFSSRWASSLECCLSVVLSAAGLLHTLEVVDPPRNGSDLLSFLTLAELWLAGGEANGAETEALLDDSILGDGTWTVDVDGGGMGLVASASGVFFVRETQTSPTCSCRTLRSYFFCVRSGLHDDHPEWSTKKGWSRDASTDTCETNQILVKVVR